MSNEGRTLTITLGGTDYEVPVLRRCDSREVKYKAYKLARDFETKAEEEPLEFSDRAFDLIFEYATSLAPLKDDIEEVVTETEKAQAFHAIMGVLFPFDLGTSKPV